MKRGRGLAPLTKQMMALIEAGKTPREIALITDTPNATVRSTLRRLRKMGHEIPIFSLNGRGSNDVSILIPVSTFTAIKAAGERFDMSGERAVREALRALVDTPSLLSNLLDPEA